jgi:hypothetical protein
MKTVLTTAFFLSISLAAYAQDFDDANPSTSLAGGRWELFTSVISARTTFKVDKFTGDVFVLLRKDKTSSWELIERDESTKDIQKQDLINYQMFSSDQGLRYTFLINTNSGLTWRLASDKDDVWYFETVKGD